MARRGKNLPPERIAEAKAQRARELQAIVDRMTAELALLEARLAGAGDQRLRDGIQAEIVHFTLALRQLQRGPGTGRRKPPEAGLPMPATPPQGPQPGQGGAAAPLELDS